MAEPITFDQIPVSTRKPGVYFEFNTKLARSSLPTNEQRVLIYGQRLSTGMVPALKIVDVFSDKDSAVFFGAGSIAHRMVINAIEAIRTRKSRSSRWMMLPLPRPPWRKWKSRQRRRDAAS